MKEKNDFRYVKVLQQDGEYDDQVRLLNGHKHLPPAPTATQLAEELPESIHIYRSVDVKGEWCIYLKDEEHTRAKTLPDALGLMMIYLLENKLIKQ